MASALWVTLLVGLFMLVNPGSSVAPGDEDPLCEVLRAQGAAPIPAYSANMRVLMDSWNYQNLLSINDAEAVWQQVDNDANNRGGLTTYWIQNTYPAPCRGDAQVCGYLAGPQDNWLITQLINRTVNGTRLSQVSVLIELESACGAPNVNCQRTFNTHIYETSSENVDAARLNTSNYRQVWSVSPDVPAGERVNETIVITFNTGDSFFYFAIQDESTCIYITRLIIFYHVCPSQTVDLIQTPEIIAPATGSPLTTVTGHCVKNAEYTSNSAPRLICSPGGNWTLLGSGCRCELGYTHRRVNGTNICSYTPATTTQMPLTTTTAIPPSGLILNPPTKVEPHCSHVIWRNSPNVSCENIIGYEVRLFNPDTNKEVIRPVDATATYHNFLLSDKALTEQKSTTVQVRVVSSTGKGPYSSPEEVGCFVPPLPSIYFELNRTRYDNNSVINIFAIGEGDNALLCKTNKQNCCGTRPNRFGEFVYPSGVQVPIHSAGQDFYRNRGDQLIRLNRRGGASSPTGKYYCVIPDANGVDQKIFVNII